MPFLARRVSGGGGGGFLGRPLAAAGGVTIRLEYQAPNDVSLSDSGREGFEQERVSRLLPYPGTKTANIFRKTKHKHTHIHRKAGSERGTGMEGGGTYSMTTHAIYTEAICDCPRIYNTAIPGRSDVPRVSTAQAAFFTRVIAAVLILSFAMRGVH